MQLLAYCVTAEAAKKVTLPILFPYSFLVDRDEAGDQVLGAQQSLHTLAV